MTPKYGVFVWRESCTVGLSDGVHTASTLIVSLGLIHL